MWLQVSLKSFAEFIYKNKGSDILPSWLDNIMLLFFNNGIINEFKYFWS